MEVDIDMGVTTCMDTVTSHLTEARTDLGITQRELAAATGISLKTIVNIETKQHIPSLLYAMRLAEYLHQPVTSLFCYQPVQPQDHL